jgi:hypothetical protein
LSYQWQTNGVNVTDGGIVSGSATSTLTLTNVTASYALSYQVVVTNANGSVTSSPAILTVLPATTLLDAQFYAGAGALNAPGPVQTGAAILGSSGDVWGAYSTPYYGYANPTYTLTNSTGVSNGMTLSVNTAGNVIYTAYYSGSDVDLTSSNLMTGILEMFNNNVQPGYFNCSISGLSAYTNENFTLVIYAARPAAENQTLTLLAGASGGNTASTLHTSSASRKLSSGSGVAYNTFTGTLTNGTLTFQVTGDGSQGVMGLNGFQLLLAPTVPPVITSAPASRTNYVGDTATFSVSAVTSSGSLSYQWQANGTNLTDVGIVSGSTTSTLTLTGVTTNSALAYQVIVSNGSGSVTSSVANLTVFTYPVAGSSFTLGVTLGVPQTVQIIGGKYAPSNADGLPLTVTSVTGATNGTVSTDGTNITYTATNTAVGATNDSFTYTVSDGHSGTATQTISVTINTSSAAAQGFNKIGAPQLIGGYEVMTYAGIPGLNYALDWTTSLTPPIVWTPIMTNSASANGSIILSNTPSGGSDFYRTRYVP